MVRAVRTGAVPARKTAAPDDAKITIPAGQQFALCCSGGGIRSATFNLGVIQALQATGIFTAVKTVSAVSGGSYLAAAHALVTANPAPGGQVSTARPFSPPAYALRTPGGASSPRPHEIPA